MRPANYANFVSNFRDLPFNCCACFAVQFHRKHKHRCIVVVWDAVRNSRSRSLRTLVGLVAHTDSVRYRYHFNISTKCLLLHFVSSTNGCVYSSTCLPNDQTAVAVMHAVAALCFVYTKSSHLFWSYVRMNLAIYLCCYQNCNSNRTLICGVRTTPVMRTHDIRVRWKMSDRRM